jgi:hypothetical protein
MKKTKIIFLDIDGVLVTSADVRKNYLPDLNHGFSQECVKNLDWLVEKNDAKIIISSSWRHGDLKYIQDIFKVRGFKNWKKIIGETERGRCTTFAGGAVYSYCPRGVEIKHWLENNDYDSYVIFDDDLDMLIEQQNNFINTDFLVGLTMEQAILAQQILNKT